MKKLVTIVKLVIIVIITRLNLLVSIIIIL